MKGVAITTVSAALLSFSLLAGTPALAQAQLRNEVADQLVALGLTPTDWVLTEAQVLEIENILSSNEPDDTKRGEIEKIVGN